MCFRELNILVTVICVSFQVSAYSIKPEAVGKRIAIKAQSNGNQTLRFNINIDTKISKQDLDQDKHPFNFTKFYRQLLDRNENAIIIQTHRSFNNSENQTLEFNINIDDTMTAENGQKNVVELTKFRQFEQVPKPIISPSEKALEKLINQTLHVNIKFDTQIPKDDDDEERKPVDLTKYGQFEHIANWPRDLAALIALGIRRIVMIVFRDIIKESEIPLSNPNSTTLRTYIVF